MGQADPVRHRERALAKLTLSLRITGVRSDGYHLIESEMVTIDLSDVLSFAAGDGLEVVGQPELAAGEENLVRRALRAAGRSAHVRLEKNIPVGGGLGGGSADAAAVLRWAGCTDVELAARLGADVPFCLVGGRALVSGIGDDVRPLPVEDGVFTLLPYSGRVSTVAVYRSWDRMGGPAADGPNDLEPAALAVEPGLAYFRDRLGDATGLTPRLAGSGGTWYVEGAFPDVPGAIVSRTASP